VARADDCVSGRAVRIYAFADGVRAMSGSGFSAHRRVGDRRAMVAPGNLRHRGGVLSFVWPGVTTRELSPRRCGLGIITATSRSRPRTATGRTPTKGILMLSGILSIGFGILQAALPWRPAHWLCRGRWDERRRERHPPHRAFAHPTENGTTRNGIRSHPKGRSPSGHTASQSSAPRTSAGRMNSAATTCRRGACRDPASVSVTHGLVSPSRAPVKTVLILATQRRSSASRSL
jgi:hypothetical protein